MNLEEEGYCIPCLSNNYRISEGEVNSVEFTIYRPHSFCEISKRLTLLKDFDIKIVGSNKNGIINDEAENTKTTSIKPNDSNVSEYDNVDCKVCSWYNKTFNWSQTFYISCYKYNEEHIRHYQGGVTYISFSDTVEIPNITVSKLLINYLLGAVHIIPSLVFKSVDLIYDVAKGYVLKPEELIISKNVEQYDNPTLNITCNLKIGDIKPYSKVVYRSQFPNFIFAVDSITYNLRENEAEVKLINKKIEYEE